MRKLRSIFALLVVLALSCGTALAAPSAADLASAGIGEKDWAAFGVRDVKGLTSASDSAIVSLLKAQLPAETLAQAGDVLKAIVVRVGLDESMEPAGIAFAGQLLRALTAEETASLEAPKFTLTAPADAALKPLGSIETDEIGKVFLAVLDRDGNSYLLGASATEALEKMAAAAEGNNDALYYTPANIWLQVRLTSETLAKEGLATPLPFTCELGVQDTAKSLRFLLWSNAIDQMSAASGKNLRSMMTGGFATEKPFLMGSGPLMAVNNIAMSFLPESLKPEDIAPDANSLTLINELVGQLQAVGMTWADLVKVLRNNMTIGIAGKLTTPMGEFPGLYLHVKGITETVAAGLVQMASANAPDMLGAAVTAFEKGAWKGVHSVEPVSAFVAAGPEGLLVGAMNMDQFGTAPAVIPEIAPAAEAPNCFALAVNIKELLPVLEKVKEMVGPMLYGDNEEVKGVVDMASMGMGVFDAFLIDMKNADTLSVELFFDPAKLMAVLETMM